MSTVLQQFQFANGDDLGASGDNTIVFICATKIHVVECGVYVSTDLVTGATSVAICNFVNTSASLGVTASEVTAPADTTILTLNGPTTAVTVQDGKIISGKVDFVAEKGSIIKVTMSGTPTSGAGTPYILYREAGQSVKEAGEQREGEAVE